MRNSLEQLFPKTVLEISLVSSLTNQYYHTPSILEYQKLKGKSQIHQMRLTKLVQQKLYKLQFESL